MNPDSPDIDVMGHVGGVSRRRWFRRLETPPTIFPFKSRKPVLFRSVALARLRGFLGGCGARGLRAACRSASTLSPAFARGFFVDCLFVARTTLRAAAVHLVDGCPRAPLGFIVRDAALLVALLDVARLPLLFVGIFRF